MTFSLNKDFIDKYSKIEPPFGFNGLGKLVYMRTYSRIKNDGSNENWFETIRRVVEGTYNLQKRHIEGLSLGWDEIQAQTSAQEMYDKMFNMKFLPPGRGLWAMGTDIVNKKGLAAALNNCAFVSTADMGKNEPLHKPFKFLMDMCMLGVGVGFDTEGENNVIIKAPKDTLTEYVIDDTREGWVNSVVVLIEAFADGINPSFDYTQIRPSGIQLKTFGGVSSGPQPLINAHISIREVLMKNVGKGITVTTIVDIMNLLGKCIVSGNVRRTAEISFGKSDSEEFMDLKNYEKNPHRATYGWTSNNSIFSSIGMDYKNVCERVRLNGEPGFCWLDNMRKFSRMCDPIDNKDRRVMGGNPCLEQSLESYELCCLVETFPNRHESLEDYLRTLKFAFLYAKTVTLCNTHWAETNRVQMRNRRIGCSMSGIAQFLNNRNIDSLKVWCEEGYKSIQYWDTMYSEWFCIPKSIKTTSIKPSGTVSLLAGATPGMHWPESRFYIRRVRLAKESTLVNPLKNSGYKIEDAFGSEDTVVVEIPIDVGEGIRTVSDVSMWEQLSMAAFLQRYWADNQVSSTITFNPEKEGPQLSYALDYFQYQLKGISFLPKIDYGVFPQMPYEEITEESYNEQLSKLKPLDFFNDGVHKGKEGMGEVFCDGDSCVRNQ